MCANSLRGRVAAVDIIPPVIFLMGPTASGKTALAVELVQRLPCDIVSVDSAMVYRGLDIGTAKPGPEVLAQAPHRLIDIRDPAQGYSAADFRTDALAHMAKITAAGRIPLLVGGTGLYFRALEQGLSSLPAADPEIRRQLEDEASVSGWPALHARLAEVDAEAAGRIHPNDPQRIQRALEVYQLSGRPLSDWHRQQTARPLPYRIYKFVLWPADRQQLYQRIEQRFAAMLEQGLLDEVAALYQRGDLVSGLPALRAVGYRQLWGYFAGDCDMATAVRLATTASRQYAKRQLTWLRGLAGLVQLDAGAENNSDKVLKSLGQASI